MKMGFTARLQMLTCLMVCVSSAHGIMVKYGTKGGPIEPPTPEPELPPLQPFRIPAPVWEERSNDTPDPNAQWRPQLFVPQPRYTQVVYDLPSNTPQPINNAQTFVNAYIPKRQPIQVPPPKNYFTPSQFLSSQTLPGFGLRYFVPAYLNDLQARKVQLRQEDAKHNVIETNEVDSLNRDSSSDLQWKHEKETSKRFIRNTQEDAARQRVYLWPAYIPRQQ